MWKISEGIARDLQASDSAASAQIDQRFPYFSPASSFNFTMFQRKERNRCYGIIQALEVPTVEAPNRHLYRLRRHEEESTA